MAPESRPPGFEGESDHESDQGSPGQPKEREEPKGKKHERRKRPFWRDLVVIIVAALALTILLKSFVVEVFSIPSGSMENTLIPGDRVLVSKIVYKFRGIERGDVVVFSGQGSWGPDAPPPPSNPFARLWNDATNLVGVTAPGTDYIKRVIGLPGDHVACCDAHGRVTVNGVPLNEQSYIYPGDVPSQVPFSITVPPGRLWVLGDNRGDSDDSRYRANDPGDGTVPESAVVGRAWLIIWPLSRFSDIPIPATFQQAALHTAAAAPAVAGGGTAALAGGVVAWRRRRAKRRAPGP